ncbi:hypothetical protein C5167_021106 [Papaver somniferum]|uniref:Uncharacterized protein n=2 Tax=Papaver somniferum TaxID=3469 RepID=A0A4Y7IYV5_PAPSO|nr:hypothetical protein C5167_021106 [Papaver somniferum]
MEYSEIGEIRSSFMDDGEDDEYLEPSSPTGEYYSSSSLSVSILGVLEFEIPIDDSPTKSLLKNVFIPIHRRFSSLLVTGKNGEKHWKKVTVNLDDHIKVPLLEEGLPVEYYDEYFNEYLSKMAMERLPQSRPLWEIHLFKYPTSNAAGIIVFKLHHALGDGYSLMGALFSCLQRSDNPSLPLSFPKIRPDDHMNKKTKNVLEILSLLKNTITDFTWSLWKSNMLEDQASPIRSAKEDVDFRPVSISTVTFSLDQIKEIKAKLGATINDVMVGIIFYGIRLYMETTSKDSGNARATALVVLNTREITTYQSIKDMAKPETKGAWGNSFAFFHVSIPDAPNVDTSDPLEFVFESKKTITMKKNSLGVYLTGKFLELMRKLRGPEETSKYIRNIFWKSSLCISNMIGPLEKMSLANHPVKGLYFMPVNDPVSLFLTMMSYLGKMRIGVGVEKELINHKLFCTCLEKAFERIFEAAMGSSSVSS